MKINNPTSHKRWMAWRTLAICLLTLQLAACAQQPAASSTDLGNSVDMSTGCANFEDEFWDGLHRFALEKKPFPAVSEMKAAFATSFGEGRLKHLSSADRARIVEVLGELYETLALDSPRALSVESTDYDVVLETLTGLELGDRTTPEKVALQEKIRAKFDEVNRLAEQSGASANCAAPATAKPEAEPMADTLFAEWKSTRHPAVYGGLKGLATAYQSCSAGAMPSMTTSSPNVKGISVVGTHSSGTGLKRVVSNLSAFLDSHYYLKNYERPNNSCFNVTANPMIYDYGGKPYATTATDSTLNFFKNAGSGTSALGIDCSGYVYSSLAAGGLKLKSSGRLKAIGSHGVNSRMFMNPSSNGLTCLTKASFKGTDNLRPGDILASTGHVVLITYVGEDPLGINAISKESDCSSSKIKVANFNFTILQSSPIKGGIGIDRIWAKDYLAGGGSMATAMVTHAINACKARIRNSSITTSSSKANLIRHKGTAECFDREVKLENESCVASCASIGASSLSLPME